MKTYYLFRWCVYASLSVFLFFSVATTSYGQLAKCKGKYFGNIIANNTPGNYTTNWNQVTMENASKWQSVEGTRGSYNFTGSDIGFNWAANNGGLFKYHTLMWGAQTPGWVSSASSATIQSGIEPYFKAVADHYSPKGGLKLIDVLNEPINTAVASNLKAALTAGYQAEPANANDKNNQYGWAIWCFQLARKHFPNTVLLINEYNVEMNWNNCRAPYIAMANAIKNAPNLTDGRKNLIDGVGLQCHGIDNLTAANFKACIDEIWTKTGLPIHITEFDQTANPNEAKQRDVYSRLIPVAWEHPNVAGITLWGYIQGQTWIGGNGQTGSAGTDSGIMYSNGQDRPAMTWLRSYLSARPSLSCCPAPAPFASCSTSTNTPPTVSITAPASNVSFIAPATISITANAADVDGTVSTVQFYNGTTLLGSDATSPYSFSWTNVAAGTYSLTAKATDNEGAVTTSTAVTVVVAAANTPPTVSITAPSNNTSFTAPASISITANAADADGTIGNVQFYNGTTLLGSDATSPYSFSWTNVVAGTYSLTAKATDNAGAVTTSTAVTITVSNPVTQAPFGGTAALIPGKIEAENYDTGGQGVAFNETTAGNSGNAYRTDDVDIEATGDIGGGYSIGWIASGEWLEYTVNVVSAGTYTLEVRVASANTGGSLHLEMDGQDVSGAIVVPNTGDWQTYQTVVVPNVGLTAGQKVMRIAMDGSWFNLNYINVISSVSNNNPPTVIITAPAASTSFTAPASITITANASDADGVVTTVQFYNGSTLLGSDTTSPYSFSWTNVAAGTYSITAVATDDSGAVSTSSSVSVIVTSPNTAPTVSITSPANNASFAAPASVTITANASDADGVVSTVQFYNGTTLLGSDATSPYSFSWTNVAAGTYSITAKATDNSGAVTTSTAVSVVVNPVVSTADIIGSDCGNNNVTLNFSLNATNRTNVTSYNWWYTGSAASTTIVTGAPYSVTIQTGPNFSAGQVCVGINLSVAPWYKQYCKSITKCAGTRIALDEMGVEMISSTVVSPNPSADLFFITAAGDIQQLSVVNELGEEVYRLSTVDQGQTIALGNQFKAGIYMIKINYLDGSRELKRIVKLN